MIYIDDYTVMNDFLLNTKGFHDDNDNINMINISYVY